MTAQAVADRFDLPIEIEDGFAEADFGEWDGHTFGEIAKRWPQEMAAWFEDEHAAPPGGESYAQIARRVQAARDRVVAAHAGRNVVVVSHVTPIKMLVRFALDAPWQSMYRMFLDPASISVIDYFADGPVTLQSFNDSAHVAG
jgi:probable phosphoglycerate mutase